MTPVGCRAPAEPESHRVVLPIPTPASYAGLRGRIQVSKAKGPARKGTGVGIFAWCAIIGCTLLVAGILFDGLLDALLPDGLVPILALPVAVFGAIGMGVTAATGSTATQVPAAVLWGVPTAAALGSGALMRWLWNRLRRSMPLDTAPPTAAELVGEKVTVLWWKDGSGEVRAITRGHQLTLPARSEQPLRSGQSAWVLDAVDSTLAIVSWEQISS